MKNSNEQVRIAIAETSAIIRSGLAALLKRLPDVNVIPVEIASMDALQSCFRGHAPEVLFVNPTFEGGFNPAEFRSNVAPTRIKCVALLSQLTDTSLLSTYDESVTLYETLETLNEKVRQLQRIEAQSAGNETESLSQREREIVICIVKGYSNKEIAEELCLSIHTVITHRRNITRKLQIHSTAGLTIYAIVNKLINLSDIQ